MNSAQKNKNLLLSVFTALFAALIAVSGFISVPLPGTPVPIVLQNMMPVLAGALLGGIQGAGATGLFLLAGILGLPVFSGGRSGLAHLLGPTGGFCIGYFIAAGATGFYIGKPSLNQKTSIVKIIGGSILGFVLIYIPGLAQFIKVTHKSACFSVHPLFTRRCRKSGFNGYIGGKITPRYRTLFTIKQRPCR